MQYYIQIFFFWINSTIKIAKPLLVASTLNEDSLQNISNYDITKGILPHIGFPCHRHIFWTASYWVGIKTNSPWHGYNHATYRLMPAHKTATLLIVAQPLNIPPHWIYFNNTIRKVKKSVLPYTESHHIWRNASTYWNPFLSTETVHWWLFCCRKINDYTSPLSINYHFTVYLPKTEFYSYFSYSICCILCTYPFNLVHLFIHNVKFTYVII